jgi:predicted transcriptional regulator
VKRKRIGKVNNEAFFAMRLPKDLWAALQAMADRENNPVSAVVRRELSRVVREEAAKEGQS